MDYRRKDPIDYADIAENLKNPAWYDIEDDTTLLDDAATAITDLLRYKNAIDRMGRFGTLFVQYSGDPRGMIGEIGDVESGNVIERAKDMVMHYGMIVDVDMNVWRPVLEDRLQFLIRCMTERTEAAEARCETSEKMVKEYQDTIVPGYRERAEKAEKKLETAVGTIYALIADCSPETCREICANHDGVCAKHAEAGHYDHCKGFKWIGEKEE